MIKIFNVVLAITLAIMMYFSSPFITNINPPPNPNTVYLYPSTGLGSNTIAPLNWQDYFENTYIPATIAEKTRSNQQVVSSLGGAYRTLPINGNVDWYFSNMAMLNYIGTPNYTYNGDLGPKPINVQLRVKEYMDRYLSFVDNLNTIRNKSITNTGIVSDVLEDSHDSYISTLLLVASNYHATYNDTVWWNANVAKLKSMANTLNANIDSGKKLTANFFYQPSLLTAAYQPQFYTEDNIESVSAQLAFSKILQQLNDASYITYLNSSNTIKQGIETNLYNTSAGRYDWSIEKAPVYGYVAIFNPSQYYPSWQAQAFTFLYDNDINQSQKASAFNLMDSSSPYWDDNTQISFQAGSGVVYPDGFLATVAAKRGLTSQATAIIQRVEGQRSAFSYVSIADIAWAAKAKKLLNI